MKLATQSNDSEGKKETPKKKQKPLEVAKLEVSDNIAKFFATSKGFGKKNWVVVGEIPVLEIEHIEKFGKEISITWKGTTNSFFTKQNPDLFSPLIEQVNTLLETKQNPPEVPTEQTVEKPAEFAEVPAEKSIEKPVTESVPASVEPPIAKPEAKPFVQPIVQSVPVSVGKPAEKSHEAIDKASLGKNELLEEINASLGVVDLSFNILMGLEAKRINWENLEGFLNRFGANTTFTVQNTPPSNLDFTKIIQAVKKQIPKEVSNEASSFIKSVYEYFNGLGVNDEFKVNHPNFNDAKNVISAYFILNDLLLGKAVGDKDNEREVSQLESVLTDLSAKTNFNVDRDELKSSIDKIDVDSNRERAIERCRSIFKEQLKKQLKPNENPLPPTPRSLKNEVSIGPLTPNIPVTPIADPITPITESVTVIDPLPDPISDPAAESIPENNAGAEPAAATTNFTQPTLKASSTDTTFRIGLLLVALSWISYNLYDFFLTVYNRHTVGRLAFEDIPSSLGISCCLGASIIVVIAVLFYVARRDLSKPEAFMALRLILIFEIGYFIFSFWPSVFVEGIPGGFHFALAKVFQLTLPGLAEGTLIPVVLAKLFYELNPNKPVAKQIKWGLIAGAAYLFVFWLSNAGNWIGAVITKGTGYITQWPINLLSFILTTVGLFLLFIYIAFFARKSGQKMDLSSKTINLKTLGIIVTALGMYLLLIFLLYLIFGAVGGWGTWYAWFLGHGYLDLWAVTTPFVGLCLLFAASAKTKDAGRISKKRYMLNSKLVNLLLYLTQVLGLSFYVAFTLDYDIPLPSTKVLTAEPIFHNSLLITGAVYFIFIIIVVALSVLGDIKE